MAKRKTRKEKQLSDSFITELKGILLVLIAIIGILGVDNGFGIAGNVVSGFAVFISGALYFMPLIICLIIGGYIIVTRKEPNYFTSRLIGLTVLMIGILVLCHMNFIKETEHDFMTVMKNTIDLTMGSIHNIKEITGGGIIGAFFAAIFVMLFDVQGTEIVSILLIVCGTIMFTGITIYDIVQSLKKTASKGIEELGKISHKDRERVQKAKEVAQKYEEETNVFDIKIVRNIRILLPNKNIKKLFVNEGIL